MSSILDHSPLPTIRNSQREVLKAIEKAYGEGYRNVLLEMSVGGGKSFVAVAAAKYYKTAHILTPRKSLQDQYSEDFRSHQVVLMKGRSSYPCTYPSADYNKALHKHVTDEIRTGGIVQPTGTELSCAEGPCLASRVAIAPCTGFPLPGEAAKYPCPYHVAIDVAQSHKIIVHNLHSFIFQAYFTGRFDQRELIVIDECHEMEGIVRGFASKKVSIPKVIKDEDMPLPGVHKTLESWSEWFTQFRNLFKTKLDQFGVSEQERFEELLQELCDLSDQFGEKFVCAIEKDTLSKRTKFTFTPEQVGNLTNKFMLNFGKKRLLMSGTIYNKSLYCKNNGLDEEETCFIRIGSSFPKANRPIYFKDEYKVDTSHKLWDQNFNEMITKIKSIMTIFDDAKGLIHTPSYLASIMLNNALRSTGRMVTHTKDDFNQVLQQFYACEEPKVLLSPTCQQGVDFNYDRARFQIILRVPYLNTSDPFVEHKVKNDFPWYNYQALVTFGQEIGRINRADDDYGVTILMDERFGKFISKNRNVLPKWLIEAIIYK